jgi:hypothetical protein
MADNNNVDDRDARIKRLFDELYPDERERMLAAARLMYAYGRTLDYSNGRLSNHGVGEAIAALHLGLRHNAASLQGADAYDAEGRSVELKVSEVDDADASSTHKTSFNYELPRRRSKEPVAEHSARVQRHYAEEVASGGHAFVVLHHCSVVRSYRLGADYMAALLAAYARQNRRSVNFGCVACRTCGQYHRINAMQHASYAYEAATPEVRAAWHWRADIERVTPAQCKPSRAERRKTPTATTKPQPPLPVIRE